LIVIDHCYNYIAPIGALLTAEILIKFIDLESRRDEIFVV
jgi:hypothetical protein